MPGDGRMDAAGARSTRARGPRDVFDGRPYVGSIITTITTISRREVLGPWSAFGERSDGRYSDGRTRRAIITTISAAGGAAGMRLEQRGMEAGIGGMRAD